MSVIDQADVRYRPYGGYEDRRLPTANWFGTVTVTGDASGGTRSAQLIFNRATALRQSRYYSIEAITATDADNVAKSVRFQTSNLGDRNRQLNLLLEASVGTSAELSALSLLVMRAFFIGNQQQAGTTTAIILTVTNVDTDAFTFSAEGYSWGPEAASAPGGGILRPTSGLYSN